MCDIIAIPLKYLSYDEARRCLNDDFIPENLTNKIIKRYYWLEQVRMDHGDQITEIALCKIKTGKRCGNSNSYNDKTYAQAVLEH